ncbi:hypothetical protein Ari01nite_86990 [Paractinoplanes rishiriensis]|uniref:BON domain-containing protein n=2 Tax=Paractinoplanes rishiriensis TaxID=1050105 RepID=A0A919K7S1_9ACTN|nr:hypothetical protein Ari01nite_86990 [Actinoplanes rishiriensis]
MTPFTSGSPGEPDRGFAASPTPADVDLAVHAAHCLVEALAGDTYEIAVQAQNGVVVLEGVVASDRARTFAHRVVWAVPAVRDVSNRLVVA